MRPSRSRNAGRTAPCCRCASCCAISPPACRPHAVADAGTLWRFIVGQWPEQLRPYADPLQRELLGRARAGPARRARRSSRRLKADASRSSRPCRTSPACTASCRFLVTSRTYAYQRQDWKLEGFAAARAAALHARPDRALHRLLVRAHGARPGAPDRDAGGRRRGDRAQARHHAASNCSELAARPLLLTLMARLQTQAAAARCPRSREEAVRPSRSTCCSTSGNATSYALRPPRPAGRGRTQPRRVAERQPREHPARNRPAWPTSVHLPAALELDRHRRHPRQDELIKAALRAASRERPDARLMRIEEYLRDRAGLAHLRTARAGTSSRTAPSRSISPPATWRASSSPTTLSRLATTDPNRWREVTSARRSPREGTPRRAVWDFVEELCGQGDEADQPKRKPEPDSEAQWGALLAGQVAARNRPRPPPTPTCSRATSASAGACATGSAACCAAAVCRRANARWPATCSPHSATPARSCSTSTTCASPWRATRRFLDGRERSEDSKAPLHRNETLAYDYWIAESPVTVAQFAQFVAASA
jgi:hypothetical protein